MTDGVVKAVGTQGHFVSAMGLELWSQGGTTHGRAAIRPELCVPGTTQLRIGVLATMVDLVAGSQPEGPINPTVDLRLQILGQARGPNVHLRCDVLRAGRTLLVAETRLYGDGDDAPFAVSVVTFMNRRMTIPGGGSPAIAAFEPMPSIDELLAPRFDGHNSVEVDPSPRLTNGVGGTVQGGVLALLAELLTERALSRVGPVAIVDLDIRYLNRVKAGPIRAVAEIVAPPPEVSTATTDIAVRVKMTDVGDGDRLVAFACTTARPL